MALRARGRDLLALCRKPGFRSAFLTTSPHPAPELEGDTKENEAIAPEFTNRNPHNLERLALARKERGWATVWPPRAYWHRLRVRRTQHHIEAFVEHHNGDVVVSASTQEAISECHEGRWDGTTGTPKNL
ncbi:39S ribosomal protein L18, mitochondrial isoform X2 [Sarcophilus harrisii]|uniref:39S ribosomal protein L18, mitochondrial isoform X2 n=1 Tax=Sarcophilus harrisii TaxID=9305 RepID=UPI0013020828|nr:39S ribosomal protein L18, mitochondrial isoform X2 [Sarcophilus harrisii]